MAPVAVVTDTTAYLPAALTEQLDIALVPLYVIFGPERIERESDIVDYPAFFEQLRSADSLPSTSQPSVGDFAAVYEPLLAEGREVVSVHISGGLSGTPEAARQAAEQLRRGNAGGERVRVVDSTTAAGGLGMLVIAAARAAAAGADAEQVERTVRDARAELKMWFALDTLEFLRRGGRVGAASAWIGSTLRVKPILSVENELSAVERVRTRGRAFERMVDYARQRHDSGADGWAVQHVCAADEARRLAERCRDEVFDCDPLFVSEIGPVLSAHTGPGLLGVGAIPTRFLA